MDYMYSMEVDLKFLKGQRVETAIVLEWLKNKGDYVKKGDAIARVETFKITTDVHAPCDGVIQDIFYNEYDYVRIDECIAVIS